MTLLSVSVPLSMVVQPLTCAIARRAGAMAMAPVPGMHELLFVSERSASYTRSTRRTPVPEHEKEARNWFLQSTILAVTIALVMVGSPFIFFLALGQNGGCGDRTLKCNMQMSLISEGFIRYAEQHEGALPSAGDDWVSVLVQDDLVSLEFFFAPSGWEDDRASYFYVPAQAIDPSGTRVLLYEMPGLHPGQGVHIAYHDGRVELVPADEAESIIASLTFPDGPPSRPAIDPDAPLFRTEPESKPDRSP